MSLTRSVEEAVAARDELFPEQAHTVRPHAAVPAVVEAVRHRLHDGGRLGRRTLRARR
ncbi:hypothetical protein [Streptomyces sp. NPDC008001]|uniref:hypothetical protein n=1 Tax=Streptomyces sp. NPDC008001 TaxID=3364804 RepID=UPI0036EAA6F0